MNKIKSLPFLPVGVLFVLFIGVAFLGGNCLMNTAVERADKECTQLCNALDQKKVELTDFGCVCRDPKTDQRNVYTGANVNAPITLEIDQ